MKKILLALLLIPAISIFMQTGASAVDLFKKNCEGSGSGSTVCQDQKAVESADKTNSADNPIYGPEGVITKVVNILTAAVAIGAVVSITYAGIKLIFSGSNPQEANSARERIIYACVALIIVVLAQTIVKFIINKV